MRRASSGVGFIFVGALLTVCFAVGLSFNNDPSLYIQARNVNIAREQFASFCGSIWLPCGIIGIPMLLISLIVCLYRESRQDK